MDTGNVLHYKDQVRSVVNQPERCVIVPQPNVNSLLAVSSTEQSTPSGLRIVCSTPAIAEPFPPASPLLLESPALVAIDNNNDGVSGRLSYRGGTPVAVAELIVVEEQNGEGVANQLLLVPNDQSAVFTIGNLNVRKSTIWLGGCGLLLVLLIATIFVVLFVDTSSLASSPRQTLSFDATTNPTSTPTKQPSLDNPVEIIRIEKLQEFINSVTLSNQIVAYPSNSTAEERALAWLIEEDPLQLDIGDSRRIVQRFALATFYYELNTTDANLFYPNWLIPSSECDWEGLTCAADENDPSFLLVTGLDRLFRQSRIPFDIGLLTGLSTLRLRPSAFDRVLTTTIPFSFGRLTDLRDLRIQGGGHPLTGTMDPISLLRKLEHLDVSRNRLAGSVPPEIFEFRNLTRLYLNTNSLTSLTVPSRSANLSSLMYIDLSNNQLNGTIPSGLFQISSLISINMTSTFLMGKLPQTMGLPALTSLNVASNAQLGGSIPMALYSLTRLRLLNLGNNNFSGKLRSLEFLRELEHFRLGFNQLSGSIPQLPSAMRTFHVLSNSLSGPLPESMGTLTNLATFSVGDNALTGTVPVSLSAWTSMVTFDIQRNNLEGPIPTELGQAWPSLVLFQAGVNSLSGTLPQSIGQWTSLRTFNVEQNMNLTGTTPESVVNWVNISSANFAWTNLNGVMPFCDITSFNFSEVSISANCNNIECPCCHHCRSGPVLGKINRTRYNNTDE